MMMKKRLLTIVISLAMCFTMTIIPESVAFADGDDVSIDSINFPDPGFRAYIRYELDINSDGALNTDEIEKADVIDFNEDGEGYYIVKNLKGMETFNNLQYLYCQKNEIEYINLSGNTKLKELNCESNLFKSLDLSCNAELQKLCCSHTSIEDLILPESVSSLKSVKCEESKIKNLSNLAGKNNLEELVCNGNDITSLDLSGLTKLKKLECKNCDITSLNLEDNSYLENLSINDNPISELILPQPLQGSESNSLKEFLCSECGMTDTLDLSFCKNLKYLNCENNSISRLILPEAFTGENSNSMTDLACGCNQIQTLELGICKNLNTLSCGSNEMEEINTSDNEKLSLLSCSYQDSGKKIKRLNVTNNKKLENLFCDCNELTELDLSENKSLIMLNCKSNNISSLNLLQNENLVFLFCDSNKLQGLDLSKNKILMQLTCTDNMLTELDISYTRIFLEPDFNLFYIPFFGVQRDDREIKVNMTKAQLKEYKYYKMYLMNYKVNAYHGHKLVLKDLERAELKKKKNGHVKYYACDCGAWFSDAAGTKEIKDHSTVQIAYPKTFTLSAKSYSYDGEAKKPVVTVKDAKGKVISPKAYNVTYSNNKNVGKAKVTIDFNSSTNYSGIKELEFKINPPKTKLTSVSAGKKFMTVKWAKQTKSTTGYEIQYAKSANFKGAKIATVANTKTTLLKVKRLASGKKYFVRVRTYKKVSGTRYYSAWSSVKSVLIK